MKHKQSVFAVLAAFALLSGCATSHICDPRIVIDRSLRGDVSVLHVGYGEIKSGSRTVDLTLRSERSSAQTVKVATQWFSNGQAYSSLLSNPRPVSLLPNEVTTIHEVAPNAKQDSFRIVISKKPI
ncbi:MAG: DUF1425 domain-containing protein [Kiritimatiellia bacterium]